MENLPTCQISKFTAAECQRSATRLVTWGEDILMLCAECYNAKAGEITGDPDLPPDVNPQASSRHMLEVCVPINALTIELQSILDHYGVLPDECRITGINSSNDWMVVAIPVPCYLTNADFRHCCILISATARRAARRLSSAWLPLSASTASLHYRRN